MTERNPFDDPDQLKLPPEWLPKYAEPFKPVPEKIRKRREQFVMVPLWWYERLSNPVPASRCTVLVALYVLHLHWRNYGKPFRLANGMLKYDGISPDTKTRALKDLEQRGLVTVEWRERKSPIVKVIV
jgi:DNA-binding transcriptional ArsR family regulator